eukprot:TRINITY_DN14483_c0_g3_i1.p1 TRINITY_DN14483_c0_g3~~TRINITY_DN14483_c0_g3_i1.p1  ORF type:complete len:431 (-),score=48.65 TRINITY_DN14483_c0_g3_i1:331-1623(-)
MSSDAYTGDSSKQRLLVVGCGPAGIAVVRGLARDFRIVVVDPKDYYEYTPGILRGFVNSQQLDSLHVTLRDVINGFESVSHLHGTVVSLGMHSAEVRLGDGSAISVPFDFAVLATGSQYSGGGLWKVTGAPGEEGWTRLSDRRAGLHSAQEQLRNINRRNGTAIVLGAGLVGVELAAELAHFMPELKVVMASRSPDVLPTMPEAAREYAMGWLTRHGVILKLGKHVPVGGEAEFLGIEGPCVVYNCAGIKMRNEFAAQLNCCDETGAILVNHAMQVLCNRPSTSMSEIEDARVAGTDHLSTEGVNLRSYCPFEHIFALGDCVCLDDAAYSLSKDIYPAEAAAEIVIQNLRNLLSAENGRKLFDLQQLRVPLNEFIICSLGPDDAVFASNGSVLATGWAAATMKNQIESTKMGQYRQQFWGSLVWSLVPHW